MQQVLTYTISLRLWMSLCILGLSLSFLKAEVPTDLFVQANFQYEQGNFAGAATLYDSVLSQGFESAELYYNLANSHYKLSHIAPAILNYERALKMDPTHEDARFNLQLANLRVVDRVTPSPEFFALQAWRNIRDARSSGQWGGLGIFFLWLAAILGAGFLFVSAPGLKRISFFGGLVCVTLFIASMSLAFHTRSLEIKGNYGIIISQNVYVKSAPDAGGTDLFILHEGAKVQVDDQVDGWLEVVLTDGKKGWLQVGALAFI